MTPARLAEMLVRVVNHPAEVVDRGRNALAYARSALSWDRRVPAFESVYERAVELPRDAPAVSSPVSLGRRGISQSRKALWLRVCRYTPAGPVRVAHESLARQQGRLPSSRPCGSHT